MPKLEAEDASPARIAPERDGAIRGLALTSLTAVKYAQDARWPCLVRPITLPRVNSSAKPQ